MAVEKERAKHDSGTVGAETLRVQGRAHPGTKAARAAVRLLTVQRNNSIVMTVWWMISCLVSVGNKAIRENRSVDSNAFSFDGNGGSSIMGDQPADLLSVPQDRQKCQHYLSRSDGVTETVDQYKSHLLRIRTVVVVLVLQTEMQPYSTCLVFGSQSDTGPRNRNDEVYWAIPVLF